MPYPFLSDEWMVAAREIREKYADEAPDVEVELRINLGVFDVPFRDGQVDAHLDTSSGSVELELGHLDEPDVTITTDYETAKSLFVFQDPAIAMQAFMNGKVKVQGDMMKLMAMQPALQGGAGNADGSEVPDKVADEIRAITEP